jgi:cytochrome c biogenesis protein CcdA
MALALLAFLGGVLTIASPCVLPVLPFVFARTGEPFARGVLPMLLGMAGAFALAATLASIAGGWAAQANTIGRDLALAGLALFGLSLVSPRLGDYLARPLTALGERLTGKLGGGSVAGGIALGACLGLLWAPCAGPILGLILTTAALKGAGPQTTALLFVYALGAAAPLALSLFAGGRALRALKPALPLAEALRRAFGVLALITVAAIASGVDLDIAARLGGAGSDSVEQALFGLLHR